MYCFVREKKDRMITMKSISVVNWNHFLEAGVIIHLNIQQTPSHIPKNYWVKNEGNRYLLKWPVLILWHKITEEKSKILRGHKCQLLLISCLWQEHLCHWSGASVFWLLQEASCEYNVLNLMSSKKEPLHCHSQMLKFAKHATSTHPSVKCLFKSLAFITLWFKPVK